MDLGHALDVVLITFAIAALVCIVIVSIYGYMLLRRKRSGTPTKED